MENYVLFKTMHTNLICPLLYADFKSERPNLYSKRGFL